MLISTNAIVSSYHFSFSTFVYTVTYYINDIIHLIKLHTYFSFCLAFEIKLTKVNCSKVKMKYKLLRAATIFISVLVSVLQSIPEVEGKGSSGGGRGSGGRGSSASGGGSRYTSSSSSKSFGGTAISFGAGAYTGYKAQKISKKVRLEASYDIDI